MKKYIRTNIVEAKPMTRGEYNDYRGWTLPADENGEDAGYLVKYHDGYVSWCPQKEFKECSREVTGMNFAFAVEAVKNGKKIARDGWNGRGMFVVYQKGYPQGIPCNKQTAEAWGLKEGDLFICRPYLQIKNVDGSHSMWVPSIGDVLADDWVLVE